MPDDLCSCGSGEDREAEYDARGIFLVYACVRCRKDKLKVFRKEVLENSNYECDEPVYEE